jgi:hypothetical protein
VVWAEVEITCSSKEQATGRRKEYFIDKGYELTRWDCMDAVKEAATKQRTAELSNKYFAK